MLLFALIFVGVFAASAAALIWVLRPRADRKVQGRLRAIQTSSRQGLGATAITIDASAAEQTNDGLRQRSESNLARHRWSAWIPTLLRESNSSWSGVKLLLVCSGFALGALLVATLAGAVALVSLGIATLAAYLPVTALRWKRTRRLTAFDAALPDAIDLMSRSLQAGYSVQQMIEVSSEQAREPVRGEFVTVHREQGLGFTLRDSLLAMVNRVPSQDLRFVVTAILIQKETGGDMVVILERTAHVIRERMRVAGEVRTRTAQGRLTGWILTALPIVLLGVTLLITPSYAEVLFRDPTGQKLLWGAATMLVVGGVLIRKVTKVEV